MTQAAELMTKTVYTVSPDDTVGAAAKVLAAHGISAAPVCDKGHLIGVISEGDLMRPFAGNNNLKRSWWLSLLAEGTELSPVFLNYISRDKMHVRDLMSSPAITATESTTLPQIAELLVMHKIKRVPILRDDRVVGIVSRADIIRGIVLETTE